MTEPVSTEAVERLVIEAIARLVEQPDGVTLGEAVRGLVAERDALRSAIEEAVEELNYEHLPEWTTPEAKAAGKDPVWCMTCGTADGSWPCVSKMLADDLAAALAEGGSTDG